MKSPRSTLGNGLESLGASALLTQEMVHGMLKLIEGAMQAGAGHARVQLLRQSTSQFHYVTAESSMTLPVHDAQTLTPLEGSRQRIQLSRPAHDLVQWVRGQGLQAICATGAHHATRLRGEPSLAPWIYVIAVFVPMNGGDGRLGTLWNGVYMVKSLDSSAFDVWATRTQRALSIGASHTALCTLYHTADYADAQTTERYTLKCDETPRNHLTMQPLLAHHWWLDRKFLQLVGWARQCGFTWTLCHKSEDVPQWAYFTLLLDPLAQYEQIPK